MPEAQRHELMPGRVVVDGVDAVAEPVTGTQFGQVAVRVTGGLQRAWRPHQPAEGFGVAAAPRRMLGDRGGGDLVEGECVDIVEVGNQVAGRRRGRGPG